MQQPSCSDTSFSPKTFYYLKAQTVPGPNVPSPLGGVHCPAQDGGLDYPAGFRDNVNI